MTVGSDGSVAISDPLPVYSTFTVSVKGGRGCQRQRLEAVDEAFGCLKDMEFSSDDLAQLHDEQSRVGW